MKYGRILQLLLLSFFLVSISFFTIAGSDNWNFIVASQGPLQYRHFLLQNPPRAVIDIKNGRLLKLYSPANLNITPVKHIRLGHQLNNTLRLVFDLNYLTHMNIQLIRNAPHTYRMVVGFANKTKVTLAAPTATTRVGQLTTLSEVANRRDHQVIVVIDPGHGGKDPGASGPGGKHEKSIVLAISKDLQNLINAQPGFKAYLTRQGDYYLTLRQRLAIARRDKADMFVAIHADAWKNKHSQGASIFALSQRGATGEAARWLARQENQSELMGGVELADKSNILKSVLINLSQTATIRASLQIGEDIMASLGKVVHLHHKRIEQAAFVVLKSPDIPSLLIETGFISNPSEEHRLMNAKEQKVLASAVMRGIRQYFLTYPPRGTWLAKKDGHY